jgi:hypothetical protein
MSRLCGKCEILDVSTLWASKACYRSSFTLLWEVNGYWAVIPTARPVATRGMTGNTRCFRNYLYCGIPNVAVLRVFRKRLRLKAYKLSIVQGVER